MISVDFNNLTGNTRLFLDFINSSKSSLPFFKYDFKSKTSYLDAAETIDKKSFRRTEITSIIEKSLSDYDISPELKRNLDKLSSPDSLVVFAGQQAGMLLGPMYTVIKALTARKLASQLEAELGRPVVPCFWIATDDHDFDEIKTARFLDRSGQCADVSYQPLSPFYGAPMAETVLDDNIVSFIETVKGNLIETEFTPDVMDSIKDSYRSGRSISAAFLSMFLNTMGDFGVIPVDPNFPGMKRVFLPVFKREIENHAEIFDLFESRSGRIMADGYHRQVHKTKDSLNLFLNEKGRKNILWDNVQYRLQDDDIGFSEEKLLEILESRPESFSPNVCLRPAAQCFAFPTIAQIVGPSEAAYFAQIEPLFNFLDIPWPVIRPRLFSSVMEPQIKRNFEKLSLDFVSLYNDTEHEISRVIKANFPAVIQDETESMRREIENKLVDLAEPLKKSDPGSHQAIEHAQKRIDHEFNHLSKKLFSVHKKRHDTVKDQIHRAAGFMFPAGRFQERVLSPLYFINKFGHGIFKLIDDQLDMESSGHQIIEI